MSGISVKLETFEGPLDLLLHLIKKEKVDIYDIPIAEITHQYLDYLDRMRELNIYIAAEFLLMAATLVYIKSKMLLPKKVDIEGEMSIETEGEEGDDPRKPLVEKLIEYQRIKDMMTVLEGGDLIYKNFFPRGYTEFKLEYFDGEFDAYELVKAFYDLVKKMPEEKFLSVELENISIVDMMNRVIEDLKERQSISFFSYARQFKTRLELVVFFLSLLELAKLRMIYIVQKSLFADIEVGLRIKEID
ncbi:MAG: segregation/condensation protein A [bacterium]